MNTTAVAGFGERVYDTTGNRCFSGSGDRTIDDHCFFTLFIIHFSAFRDMFFTGCLCIKNQNPYQRDSSNFHQYQS